jgi:hypothetical protein
MTRIHAGLTLVVGSLLAVGGCPLGLDGFGFPLANTVRLELVNESGFDVAPNIVFDKEAGFFSRLVSGRTLATGLIAPGETLVFSVACEELGYVYSNQAEQIGPGGDSAFAGDSRVLERDKQYECGDVVRFLFIGNGADFGVAVSVNGRIVG